MWVLFLIYLRNTLAMDSFDEINIFSLTLHTLAESVSYFSLDYRSYLPIVYVYLR